MAGKKGGYAYVSLDEDAARGAAEADPVGFVADLPDRVVLDEVQRAPALFPALKMDIDRRRIEGRFLLIGSSHVLLLPKLADSLAGRLQLLRLHPLSQSELASEPPGFLDALFSGAFGTWQTERLAHELAERVAAGGYPPALKRRPGRRRANWYRDYADAIVQRDIRDLARISAMDALRRLLTLAASQTARLFNLADMASPFNLSRPTIRDYVALLERVFLLERLPPWHGNRLNRLVKTPKLHLGDPGLACALLNADAAALAADRALLGQMLETFAFQELRRQAGDLPLEFFHYRDRDQFEVDIVIERGAREIAGIEVKAAATVTPSDFRGLRKLRNVAGKRFVAGIVLYDGETCASFGEGFHAVPVRALWEARLQGVETPPRQEAKPADRGAE